MLYTRQVNEHKQMQHVETGWFIICRVDVCFSPRAGRASETGKSEREGGRLCECVSVCVSEVEKSGSELL